jgi:uncharacterized protein
MDNQQTYSAFDGDKLISQGALDEVALKVRKQLQEAPTSAILIFSDTTGKQMDFDLRGSAKDVLQRLKVFREDNAAESFGPGRPKLGVVSREISLLPRHWEWLSTQSGGASATLRRLVDEARKQSTGKEQVKQAQERAYKFMAAIAGNLPNFEEALRALFAKNKKMFETQVENWPRDIRKHAGKLAEAAFS